MSRDRLSQTESPTIIQRLHQRIQLAQQMGFQVRNEWLDGMESTWCEVGGTRILFIDLSKNAVEQLEQVNQAIDWCRNRQRQTPPESSPAGRAA